MGEIMKRLSLCGIAALVFVVLAPFSATASAQTTPSVCTESGSPCAGTPFAQVPEAPAADGQQARSPLARTGVNTELLLMMSVVALGLGCLVLLVVEARENNYVLRPDGNRVRVTH